MRALLRHRHWPSGLVIVSALLYCSWPLGLWLNPTASRRGLASELGAEHQPYDWFFIGADVLSGLLLLWGVIILYRIVHPHRSLKLCLILLGLYGACGALDAALPLSCLPSLQVCGSVWQNPLLILHGIVDIMGSAALLGTLGAAWWYVRHYSPKWMLWLYVIGGGGAFFAALSLIFILVSGPGYWAQRYYLTLSCIWVASIPFILLGSRRRELAEMPPG